MDVYPFGKVSWLESQLIYHAMASLGREGLILLSPETPYVCVGYHQDVDQEVDLEFCRAGGIPMFRRQVGGGAVFLDGRQYFFQLVLRRENPLVPPRRELFYRTFLQPVIQVYRRIGIPAEYKPVNDVIVETRKISGTGVGEIEDCIVFVGNLIYDFDYAAMSRVLKIPDEKFRDKVKKTIEENLSTIRRELGPEQAESWTEPALNALLIEEFQGILGPLEPRGRDRALDDKIEELTSWMHSEAWLHRQGRRRNRREITIRSGVRVVHRMHKAAGGLIRAVFELRDGRYADVSLSGDWFCYPPDALGRLETMLEGRAPQEVPEIVDRFYEGVVETPGVGREDWLAVLAV